MTPVVPLRERPASRWIPLLGAALVFAALCKRLWDPDIWFHLAIGRRVVESGQVPAAEFYVLPLLGQPSQFHEWGFGTLSYLIQQLAGYLGLGVFNSLLGLSTLGCLAAAALTRSERSGYWPVAIAGALALWLMEFRVVYRPETLLYLALAAALWVLERYRRDPRFGKLLWLLPITWGLALCHPSAVMLFGLLGAYAIEQLWQPSTRKSAALHFPVVALLMTVAASGNPYGLEQLLLPLRFAGEKELLDGIVEFLPAWSTEYRWRFLLGALLGIAALLLARPSRIADWIVFLAFLYLAYKHGRNIALLGIACFLPLHALLVRWAPPRGWQMRAEVFGLAILALTTIAVARQPGWGLGLASDVTPVGSADQLKRTLAGGNVFNFYHLGNYLAWALDERFTVFIDGRNFSYGEPLQIHDYVMRAEPGWPQVLDRFAIDAVVTRATLEYSGQIIPLVQQLATRSDWLLVAREPSALLFVRGAKIAGRESLAKQEIWLQAVQELRENLERYPESVESFRSMALVHEALGQGAGAGEWQRRYLALKQGKKPD